VTTTNNRRIQPRRKLKLQKIFAAEFIDAATGSCFLHIYDLSIAGMRVHTDHPFEDGASTRLRLFLDNPLEVRVTTVWTKELYGGMYVTGLAFDDLSPEANQDLAGFIEKHSPDNMRRSLRLQRILPVEIKIGSITQKMSVFTLDISVSGMRISYDYPLPENMDIPFSVVLDFDREPVELVCRVSWQEENTLGQYVIGLQFVEPTSVSLERIQAFIESYHNEELASSMTELSNFDQ
jgi:hypothetical protein